MTASASSAMKAARPASLRRLLGSGGAAGVCFAGAGVCLARGSDRFSVVAGKGFGPQGAFLREIFPRNPAANRLRSGPIMAVRSSWSVAGGDACLKAITGKIHTDRTAHFREPCRARAGNCCQITTLVTQFVGVFSLTIAIRQRYLRTEVIAGPSSICLRRVRAVVFARRTKGGFGNEVFR